MKIADELPLAFDGGDKPVAAPVQCLDEPRIIGVIAERAPQPFDGGVQAVLEVDERSRRPQALTQLVASHDVTGPLDHHRENLEGLILKPDADAPLSQLARAQINLEGRESLDVWRGSFQGQHRKEKFTSPAAHPGHFIKM